MSMCDGRLLPMAWLYEFGHKDSGTLLLQDYVYEAPRLTNEEAQFPELFRVTIKVMFSACMLFTAYVIHLCQYILRHTWVLSGGLCHYNVS